MSDASAATVEPNTTGHPNVWEVTPDDPAGRCRPMTDDEYSQWLVDQQTVADATAPLPSLQEQFSAVVDAVLAAPDFDTAKQQIAAITNTQEAPDVAS